MGVNVFCTKINMSIIMDVDMVSVNVSVHMGINIL